MSTIGSTSSVVVKGDLDSTIHQSGFGSFGDLGSGIAFVAALLGVKIAAIAFLVGLYYLFSFSALLGLLVLAIAVVLIVLYFNRPKKVAPVVPVVNPHLLRAEAYEREGNHAMALHTRRIHNL